VSANVSITSLRAPPLTHADAAHYAAYGYVVRREVVPRLLIENLLTLYGEKIVPSRYPFFRQNSNAYEANKLSAQGYVKQSFLDIHDYGRYAQFSSTAREIFCSGGMMAALGQVTGFDSFALMQTMLFDQNTETPAHQDWYYLDSAPGGNLIAAWIALEDIDERAGRFYVLPGSHREDFGADASGRTHEQACIGSYLCGGTSKRNFGTCPACGRRIILEFTDGSWVPADARRGLLAQVAHSALSSERVRFWESIFGEARYLVQGA
jgi:hypothetical protein